MEKKNYGIMILVAILFLIIGGIGTYVIINNSNDNEPIVDNNDNNQQNDNDNTENEGKIESVDNGLVPNGYTILLNSNGDLYLIFKNNTISQKYGDEYKIASNVSDFYNIMTGQGGGNTLYFIYNDKTVGQANIEYNISANEDIKVINKIQYENIVKIKQGISNDISAVAYPIFVDANGKEYHN